MLMLLPVLLVIVRLLVVRWSRRRTKGGAEGFVASELTDIGRSIANPACQILAADGGEPVVFSELMRKHPSDLSKCIVPGAGFGIITDPKTCTLKEDVKLSRRKRPDPNSPPFVWKNPLGPEAVKKGLTFNGLESVLWGDECVVSFKDGLTRAQLKALDQETYNGALKPLSTANGGYLPDAKGIGMLLGVDRSGCAAVTPKGDLAYTSCDPRDESQQFVATPLRAGGSKVESMQHQGKCLNVQGSGLALGPCKSIVDPADEAAAAVDDSWAFSSPIVPLNPLKEWSPRDHLFQTAVGNQYLSFDSAKNGITTSTEAPAGPIAFVPLDAMPDAVVMPAKAASISGRYVRLQALRPGCMHVAEVKVYDEAGINVAAGKTVTMSSEPKNNKFPGHNLVNTNLKDYAATGCDDVAWMQIDLGATHKIARIRVTNRIDCCQEQLVGTTVSIVDASKKFVYTSPPLTAEPVQELDLGNNKAPVTVMGRYVRLQAPTVGCMHVTEVEVFDESGVNLALRRSVTMSSEYVGNKHPAGNLVNGNRSDFAHTSCNEDGWMQIDLGSVQTIARISVTNRVDASQELLVGTVLSVLDAEKKTIFTSEPLKADPVQDVDLSKNRPFAGKVVSGRYVRVHRVGLQILNLNEIDVLDKQGNRLALNKPVTMSSQWRGNHPVGNLVNGNRADFAATNGDEDPWMQVDLGGVHDIARIRVINHLGNPPNDEVTKRLVGAQVSVLDGSKNVVFTSAPLTADATQDVDLATNVQIPTVKGKYVRIRIARPYECFHLNQVDVLDKVCNRLALNKSAMMSSDWVKDGRRYPAGNAVNGSRHWTNIAHTNCDYIGWYEVNLGDAVDIAHIRVTNALPEPAYRKRIIGAHVMILDANRSIVYTSAPLNEDVHQMVDVAKNVPYNNTIKGRYVRIEAARVSCFHIAELNVHDKLGNHLARNKPVSMSSVWDARDGRPWPATNLVNGNQFDMAHTSCNDVGWMEVNLGDTVEIAFINMLNRWEPSELWHLLSGATLKILDANRTVVFKSAPLTGEYLQAIDLTSNYN